MHDTLKCHIDVHMKMDMCMCAVRLGGLPIQCPGMAKSLATPLTVFQTCGVRKTKLSRKIFVQ